jgi:hypothetical protein
MKIIQISDDEILKYNEASDSPNDFIPFWAGECLDCDWEEIRSQNFILTYDGELEEVDFDVVEEEIFKKTGCRKLRLESSDLGKIVSVSQCPKCGGECIMSDF